MLTIAHIFVHNFFSGYLTDEELEELYDTVWNPLTDVIVFGYAILGIIFFIVGWQMLYRLKKYFPEFYGQFGGSLWFANCILTLPLLFRAAINFLNEIPAFSDYWEVNYYRIVGYNILIFFLGTYIPIVAQISSLIFGFVRHKQVKIFKSGVNRTSHTGHMFYDQDTNSDMNSDNARSQRK